MLRRKPSACGVCATCLARRKPARPSASGGFPGFPFTKVRPTSRSAASAFVDRAQLNSKRFNLFRPYRDLPPSQCFSFRPIIDVDVTWSISRFQTRVSHRASEMMKFQHVGVSGFPLGSPLRHFCLNLPLLPHNIWTPFKRTLFQRGGTAWSCIRETSQRSGEKSFWASACIPIAKAVTHAV